MSDILRVNMLGEFSIRWNGQSMDDHSNRMRKVWLLLAYLIYTRNNSVKQESYLELFRETGDQETDDPSGRLKALFYRARSLLNQLGDGAGHQLIVHRDGHYAWNTAIPLCLDTEEFDRLCGEAADAESGDASLELYLRALDLYKGELLPKLSMESWVVPISAYYHQLYLNAAEQTLCLLEERERWERAAGIAEQALKIEPYGESLYQHLMRSRLAMGDRTGTVAAYEEMSELLSSMFGVMPSEESRRLYREATREVNSGAVPITAVREQLREPTEAKGAMFCEYDFFKLLYQVQARSIIRSGETVHIALLSLHGYGRKELTRRSLDLAIKNLRELVLDGLRQGDVAAQCSPSQLILMLPQANYENSCTVCQRVIRSFSRKYPHSPANIHYSVQAMEPMAPGMPPFGKD